MQTDYFAKSKQPAIYKKYTSARQDISHKNTWTVWTTHSTNTVPSLKILSGDQAAGVNPRGQNLQSRMSGWTTPLHIHNVLFTTMAWEVDEISYISLNTRQVIHRKHQLYKHTRNTSLTRQILYG